jgi:predicted porin
MKKSLLALAALTAFTGVASAQSSVTLFGVADLNMRNVKNNTASIKSLSTDGNASSRLGVRGTEDLGGGLRAGFWLEAGLSLDNGTVGGGNGGATANAAGTAVAGNPAPSATSGAFFNRRSTVSLIGGFGEIRLGRDYTPTFWNHTVFDPFGTNGVASQTNIISPAPTVAPTGTTQTLVRANNSVGYFLPSGLGGLYGQIMIAAGENQPLGNKYQGFRVGYAAGPVNFAAAYGVTKKAGAMDGDLKAMNLGGSWNLGFMVLMGQYHSYKQSSVNELTNMMIGATVPVGAGVVKASYGKTDRTLTGGAEPGATQLGLGYTHDLSKRTTLYGHFSRVSNDAGLAYTAGDRGPAMTAGKDSTGYEFGIRHSF